jgi:single-strand DNA-binding protein
VADINRVVLVGRLTRDAELRYTASGQPVSNISLAINQRRKRDEQWVDEAHFFDAVVWGKTAESLAPYLKKGKQIGVEGELRQNRWEQDGQKRSRVEIFTTNIQLLGSRNDGGSGSDFDPPPRDASGPGDPGGPGGQSSDAGGIPSADQFDDDIPF